MEENRKEYAFILCVNKKLSAVIARGWWNDVEGMRQQKIAMTAAVRVFKKTAGVLVYEHTGAPCDWKFVERCYIPEDMYIPEEISIYGDKVYT